MISSFIMNRIPVFKLYNGVEIPSVGLGTYGLDETTIQTSLMAAFEVGAILVDTASAYNNEHFIGNALSYLYQYHGLKRSDVLIETKIGDKLYSDGLPRGCCFYNSTSCYSHDTKRQVMEQVEDSLKHLRTDYLDVLLIHWPYNDVLCELWKCLENLYDQKVVRAIGVSNFKVRHLRKIMDRANYIPMINQICISPINLLIEEYTFCRNHNIQIEAYSPLNMLRNQEIMNSHRQFFSLAEKYGKNISQVLLNWYYQKGIITIPKSGNPDRVKMNTDIFDFELEHKDIQYMDSLNYDYQYLVESKFCPGY